MQEETSDKFFNLGLSISFDHVLRLSADICDRAYQMFQNEQVVSSVTLSANGFTTRAVGNIDHKLVPRSKGFIPYNRVCLLQHPLFVNLGVMRELTCHL